MDNIFTCELCHNEYEYYDKQHLTRYAEGNTPKVCPECQKTLPGEGKNVKRCDDCSTIFKSRCATTKFCPTCRTFTCEVCHNKYIGNRRDKIKVCDDCKAKLPGEGGTVKYCYGCSALFKSSANNYCPDCCIFTCEICHKKYDKGKSKRKSKIRVCGDCKAALPGSGQYVLRCNDCGCIFKAYHNGFDFCPACRILTCEICHNEYTGDRSNNIKICDDCKDKLPGEGNYILRCRECSCIFKATHNRSNYCSTCTEERKVFTCEVCGNEYKYTSRIDKYTGIKVCPGCKEKLLGKGDCVKKCNTCHSIFKGGNTSTLCPNCHMLACEICHKKYKGDRNSDVKVCKDCRVKLPGKGNNIKKCNTCHSIFKGSPSTKLCPDCRMLTCEICHKKYKGDRNNNVKVCDTCKATFGKCRYLTHCENCHVIFKGTAKFCPTCRMPICEICHKRYKGNGNSKIKVCDDCKAKVPGKGVYLKKCDDCGTIYKGANCSCCNSTCEICHKKYKGDKDVKIKVCDDCKVTLLGEGNYLKHCCNCHVIFKGTNKLCPTCSMPTCEICHKRYEGNKYSRIKVCDECKAKLPGEGDHIKHCSNCDAIFKGTTYLCFNCLMPTCEICHNKYKGNKNSKIKVCLECKAKLPGKGKSVKHCDNCDAIFRGTARLCPDCSMLTCEICHNKYEGNKGKVNICDACKDTLPGEGNHVKRCSNCGIIFKGVSKLCPDCRTTSCVCCGAKMPIAKFGNKHYCASCKALADRISKGSEYGQCCDCGRMIVGKMGDDTSDKCCTFCKKKKEEEARIKSRTFTCELCHKQYERSTDLDHLSRYTKESIKVCPECEAILPGEGKYLLRCNRCSYPFRAYHNNFKYCPTCNEERKVFTCEMCSKEYILSLIHI